MAGNGRRGTLSSSPLTVVLAGCGAVAEFYYLPLIREAAARGLARLGAVFDPAPSRHAPFRAAFPGARHLTEWAAFCDTPADLAIIASPPRFHAEQAIALMQRGRHLLCEKPMASTLAEAEAMAAVAAERGVQLAVGHHRRFYPVSRFVRDLVHSGALGVVGSFEISEGTPFEWPAQSPSFFLKASSAGGVLADIGVHVLDLVRWWFGDPVEIDCRDDASGGLEANCKLALRFADGLSGLIQLSRETTLPNRWRLCGNRGQVSFAAGAADSLTWQPAGSELRLDGALAGSTGERFDQRQSFGAQLLNVLAAIRGEEALVVPASEGVASIRLLERCAARRRPLTVSWTVG